MNYAQMQERFKRPDVTHYEILDVSPKDCEDNEKLRAAMRAVASVVHPDRRPDDQFAALYASRAGLAMATLENPASHKAYRIYRRSTHSECTTCSGAGVTYKQQGFKKRAELRCGRCQGVGWLRK